LGQGYAISSLVGLGSRLGGRVGVGAGIGAMSSLVGLGARLRGRIGGWGRGMQLIVY